jgi:DNA-binding transcriptional LysR family regulator
MPHRRKRRPAPGATMTVMEPRLLNDWETAHVFLEVARSKSFRAAAENLRQSVNALRRKVDELEARMGFALLLRRAHGVSLTEEGRKVYEAALAMEKASFGLLKAGAGEDNPGEVTVSISEGLGSFWLAPKVAAFRRANPGLLLNLVSTMHAADVLRLEADVAVRLDRPKSSELKISKLERLHQMFYAHRSYLDVHGVPASRADLVHHRFVVQSDNKGRWLVSERHFFPEPAADKVSVRVNTGSANVAAIISGAGIGVLPTYAGALREDLVMLDIAPAYPIDIWVTYHADAKKIPRVRKAIEWLTEAFDPRFHPWFRDEFVHPRNFAKKN